MPKRDGPAAARLTLWNKVNTLLIIAFMSTATFGTTNHPFRATLPLRVLRRLPQHEPEVRARIAMAQQEEAAPAAEKRRPLVTAQDVRDFLMAYVACFMAVSAWLG